MEVAALALYAVWFALAFGVRIALQVRRTGSTGVRGLDRDAAPMEWLAGALFVTSLIAAVVAPLLALLDVSEPIGALDGVVAHVVGIVLAVAGVVGTFVAQLAMGDSWRIGVESEERTELVTDGLFGLVRNPIYSAMIPTVLGLALMVPSPVALIAFAGLLLALELQVRVVEEPYLLRVHGDDYAEYGARVGRFVPGTGLLHGVR
ncbi:MAG TPA: isoprenylcysteine carboxylmethyltransferase family protein [Solirubrobacterales bacterium]|jgi:protein-S-isoprenylcysteine O-methyltransferase Ste14